MKRRTMLMGGAAAAALVALLVWAFAPRPVEVEVAEATMGPFETTVDEDARTRVADRYVVSAPLAARLQRVSLREGDAVAAGDVVATLLPAFSPMLDERSRAIVQRRWLTEGDSATLHELAAEYGVSAERIRQIEAKAMQKMRSQLAALA